MSQESLTIDHIIMGVADLASASARLRALGLPVVPGGEHPDWGTANTIVPLGDTYLELVAVVDVDLAARTGFGSAVAEMAQGLRAWGWAVRSADLDVTAKRWDRPVHEGSRERPDGTTLRWRLTGADQIDPDRPFALQWGETVAMPGETGGTGWHLERLNIAADADALAQWLGAEIPRVIITRDQPAGVHRVTLRRETRELQVDWPLA